MDLTFDEINSILKSELNGKDYEYISIENFEEKGYMPVGLLSETKKVCLKYRVDGQVQELYLFLKLLPQIEFHKDVVIATGAFSKEAKIFKKFLMDLKSKFEKDVIPTCYIASDNDKIVLKDLASIGFKNIRVQEYLTIAHCEECIVSLAKLHSASISFERENNCKLNELIPEIMDQTIFADNDEHSGRKAIVAGIHAVRAIQKQYLSHYPEELADRVFSHMNNLGKLMAPSPKYPNIFSHCDVWSNNIMFRYDCDRVIECCLVDFQLAAVRPIGYDLLMLIYMTLENQELHSHYEYLLKYYYDKLSENLAGMNIELAALLPWDKYLNCTGELKTLFILLAPLYLHMITMPDEIFLNVIKDENEYHKFYLKDRTEYALKAAAEFPEYKLRVTSAITNAFEHFKNLKP